MDKPETIAEHRQVRDAKAYIGHAWQSADGGEVYDWRVVDVDMNRFRGQLYVDLVVKTGRHTVNISADDFDQRLREDAQSVRDHWEGFREAEAERKARGY